MAAGPAPGRAGARARNAGAPVRGARPRGRDGGGGACGWGGALDGWCAFPVRAPAELLGGPAAPSGQGTPCALPSKLSRRQKKRLKQLDQRQKESGGGAHGRVMPAAGVLGLPGWCEVRVLEDASRAEEATGWLAESMEDPVLGLDLEWKPERSPGQNHKVALLQLATERRALLLRTHLTGLPPAVAELLRRRSSVLTGFDFTCDAQKLKRDFMFSLFSETNAVDLKTLAEQMGYPHMGLARLCRHVLKREMAKSKRVATSNWEAPKLSETQVQYAALDSWVCGQMFRQLRAWHDPGGLGGVELCEMCGVPFGVRVAAAGLVGEGGAERGKRCQACGRCTFVPGK